MDGQSKSSLYTDLYALDETASEESDAGICASMTALKRQAQPDHPSSCKVARVDQEQAKPLASPITLRRAETAPATVPAKGTRGADFTATTNNRPITKGGQTSEAEGILAGLKIFFFPADKKNPARKRRIEAAQRHGALWIGSSWSEDATHVVVDKSMSWQQVAKHARINVVPDHVIVVNEDYPAACMDHHALVDPGQNQYLVKGYTVPTKTTAEAVVSAVAVSSPPLKPQRHTDRTGDLRTPSQHTEERSVSDSSQSHHPDSKEAQIVARAGDALTRAINEARLQHDMLLDEEDQSSRPSSADGPTTDRVASEGGNPNWQKNFQCMTSNTGKDKNNPNAATITILQEMATHYDQIKDTWRPIAYRKAIATLLKQPHKICTLEEAEKLPAIGPRIAAKIEEIVYTGYLRRLQAAKSEPTDQILQLFLGVYGIGFAQGMRFIAQGYKTLEDLRDKATLTEAQRIGIAHHADFNSRIPRAEVAAHGAVVLKACAAIDAKLQVFVMGSYRRGAADSGDIDTIVTHPSWSTAQLRATLLDTLIPHLTRAGFLKCELARTSRVDGTKWHGASCIPGSATWRRLDFLLVPAAELGAALIYFTGNDIFNRSMRLLASRKGMRLNQRGLYRNAMRGKGREKITEGELVEGADERRIFEALGVPWREPWERIC